MEQQQNEVGVHLYECEGCGNYWVSSKSPEEETDMIVCDGHTAEAQDALEGLQSEMKYIGNINEILGGSNMERKRVVIGKKEEIKAEEETPTTDGMFNGKRIVEFKLLMAVDMTDEELDNFADEVTVEIAEHLLTEERSDKAEKTILVDHTDVRRMSPVDGYNAQSLFEKAVAEGAAS